MKKFTAEIQVSKYFTVEVEAKNEEEANNLISNLDSDPNDSDWSGEDGVTDWSEFDCEVEVTQDAEEVEN